MIKKIQVINKIQQKRLLQLCKEFFPERKDIYFTNSDNNNINLFICFAKYNRWDEASDLKDIPYIHWYQLCLTILPERIWQTIVDDENVAEDDEWLYDEGYHGSDDIQINTLLSNHPVDFLWKFVQECKKNKYFK